MKLVYLVVRTLEKTNPNHIMKKCTTLIFLLFSCVALTFGQQSKAQVAEAVTQSKLKKVAPTSKVIHGQNGITLKVAERAQTQQQFSSLNQKISDTAIQKKSNKNAVSNDRKKVEERRSLQNLLDFYYAEKRNQSEINVLIQQIQNLK